MDPREMGMAKRLQLGNLSLRQSNRTREFRPQKTVEEKIEEARLNKILVEAWIATPGNQVYIGEHGPRPRDKRPYRPVGGGGKFF